METFSSQFAKTVGFSEQHLAFLNNHHARAPAHPVSRNPETARPPPPRVNQTWDMTLAVEQFIIKIVNHT